jgi:membrane protease YdiL (CAAX protease family)
MPARGRGGTGALDALGRVLVFAGLFAVLFVSGQLALGGLLAELAGPASVLGSAIVLGAAVGVGALLMRVRERRPAGALGFAWTSRTPREVIVGTTLGLVAIAVAVAPLLAVGAVRYIAADGGAGDWVVVVGRDFSLFAVAAAAEEALFRGYAFQVLVRGVGSVTATVAASGAFALAHYGNPNVGRVGLLNIFLAGVVLSAAYLRTRSLWFATAVHVGWNWGMATLLDLPVSGLDLFDTPLYDARVEGPDWLTGGAFGPEGGLAATAAFALALAAVLRMPGLEPAPEQRALGPLVDDGREAGTA